MTGFFGLLDRAMARVTGAAGWLALPLMAILFLQWPLRDFVRGYSREANDLGQMVFALYVAVSVTAATRAGTHLAADALAQRYSARARGLLVRLGALVGVVPWATFLLWSSWRIVLASLAQFEGFPDTFNPGYFVIKLALWLLALVVLAQALIGLARPLPRRSA